MEPGTTQGQPVTTPAAPVDTLDQAIQSGDLGAFNRIERDRRDGKAPEKLDESQVDPSPEATAGTPKDSAASRDAKREAGSEPAAPGKKPGHKDAKTRKAEIDADIQALEASLRRRDELRRLERAERDAEQGKQAGTGAESASASKQSDKAAAAVPGWKKYRDLPDAPKADDPQFAGLEDFTAAAAAFVAEKIADERIEAALDSRFSREREGAERDQALAATVERAVEHANAELEADPEILDRIDDRWKALNPSSHLQGQRKTVAHFVKDRVLSDSRHPMKISERLTENDNAELRRIVQLPPDQIIREIAYLDAEFSLNARASTTETSSKRVSTAPAPIPKLGAKASSAKDDVQAAIESGDLQAFTRAELARRRGGR